MGCIRIVEAHLQTMPIHMCINLFSIKEGINMCEHEIERQREIEKIKEIKQVSKKFREADLVEKVVNECMPKEVKKCKNK